MVMCMQKVISPNLFVFENLTFYTNFHIDTARRCRGFPFPQNQVGGGLSPIPDGAFAGYTGWRGTGAPFASACCGCR